jgi:hypothetical protein
LIRSPNPLAQAALVMTTFGLGWALLGVAGLPVGTAARVGLALVAAVVAAAVAATCLRLQKVHPRPPRRAPATGLRDFVWVNVAQVVVILVAVPLLTVAGAPALIAPVTCLVVGAHFFPLARIFGQPQYWWTGTLLLGVAAAGAASAFAGSTTPAVFVTVGFPAAAVLWATALHLSARG